MMTKDELTTIYKEMNKKVSMDTFKMILGLGVVIIGGMWVMVHDLKGDIQDEVMIYSTAIQKNAEDIKEIQIIISQFHTK